MNKTATELIKNWSELIDRRYDPENDTIPNAPRVTHTDKLLCSMISDLAKKIDSLEEKVTKPAYMLGTVEAIQAAYNCLRMALGDWYELDPQHQPDMTHFQCKRAIEFVEYAMRCSDGRA